MLFFKSIILFCLFWNVSLPFCFANTSLIDAAEEAKKSVVGIRSLRAPIDNPRPSATIDPQTGQTIVMKGLEVPAAQQNGAGVIIDPSGYIITNFHVVYLADTIDVILEDDSTHPATLIHVMPDDDLALIKIDTPSALKAVTFANSDYVEMGEEVINIGHSPFLKQTISGGRITGIGRGQPTEENGFAPIELLGVNIDLYKGDSGGPLLNRAGQLLGMVAADVRGAKATLVIPSNKIKKLYQDFIK